MAWPVGAATALMLLTVVIAFRMRPNHPSPIGSSVTRFALTIEPQSRFSSTGRHVLALSPDGRRLVYVANNQLFLRSLDRLQPAPLRGTGGDVPSAGRSPFFSPDGTWVAFWQAGKLKKVLVDGGTPVDICDAANPFGATWATDNSILYGGGAAGIFRVSADGGKPEALIRDPGGLAHGPQLLPGGRSVLFTLSKG